MQNILPSNIVVVVKVVEIVHVVVIVVIVVVVAVARITAITIVTVVAAVARIAAVTAVAIITIIAIIAVVTVIATIAIVTLVAVVAFVGEGRVEAVVGEQRHFILSFSLGSKHFSGSDSGNGCCRCHLADSFECVSAIDFFLIVHYYFVKRVIAISTILFSSKLFMQCLSFKGHGVE